MLSFLLRAIAPSRRDRVEHKGVIIMTAISGNAGTSLSAQRVEKTQRATEQDDLNEKRARQVVRDDRRADQVTAKDLKETQTTRDIEKTDLRKERIQSDLSARDARKSNITSDIQTADRQEAQAVKRQENNDELNARLQVSFSEEGQDIQSSIQSEPAVSEARGNILDTEA